MNFAQRSFARGELAPSLWARTDQAGYATGLRKLRNMYVMRHGGVTNRPGTRYVDWCRSENRRVRLIKFVFNADQTYVIEMGNHYARFFKGGARISPGSPDAWVTATDYVVGDLVSHGGEDYYATVAHTAGASTEPGTGADYENFWYRQNIYTGSAYEIPTPYAEEDLPEIRYVQSVDVITLTHPNYAPRELKRYGDTRWILSAVTFGPRIDPPANLALSGGVAGATTYWAVTSISELTGEESLPAFVSGANMVPEEGTPTIISWDPVTGASDYNVYRSSDGRTYGRIYPSSGTGTENTDNTWTTDFENITITSPAQTWQSATDQCRNPLGAITATDRPYNGKYTVRGRVTLAAASFTLGFTNGRGAVYYSRNGEPRILGGRFNLDFNLNGSGSVTQAFEWTISVPDNGYSAITIDVVPEIYIETAGTAHTCNIDFSGAPNNVVAWRVLNTGGFEDVGEIPDLLQQAPKHPALFDAAGNFPTATTFYQQRRMFANTDVAPEFVWGSQTGNYHNFSSSIPLQDDDAISFSLAGRQVNAVKHLIDLGRLLMMTSGSIHFVEGDDAGILRPDSINPRQIAYNGIGTLAPLPISDAAIYLQARQSIVRDLKPVSADSYEGSDLTVFAAHLFEGHTIVDWDYAETPHSIVWLVRDDGVMLGLTYLREHAIWGWHRHDTEGVIENICTIPEGDHDAVYMAVQRTLGSGEVVRFIERMESRFFLEQEDAFFVDSGLSYDGWNAGADTMTVTGGTTWASDELLTVTRSAGAFSASNVGDAVVLLDEDGNEFRITITAYTDALNVSGLPNATLPVSLRATPTTEWALAVDTVSGLEHLEGKNVTVYADGFVVSNPNNSAYPFSTVILGEVTLDRPYAKIIVGLPFISDFETLDLDTPSGQSRKDRGTLIQNVHLFVEKTRGIWGGIQEPPGDNPLEGLTEFKLRPAESPSVPPPLVTETVNANIGSRWNDNGRVFIRQVDPLPLTVLAAIPTGMIG